MKDGGGIFGYDFIVYRVFFRRPSFRQYPAIELNYLTDIIIGGLFTYWSIPQSAHSNKKLHIPPHPLPPRKNPAMSSKSQLTYTARASKHNNPLAKRLFEIAEAKKTNVTVSADVTTTKELLDLADRRPAETSFTP